MVSRSRINQTDKRKGSPMPIKFYPPFLDRPPAPPEPEPEPLPPPPPPPEPEVEDGPDDVRLTFDNPKAIKGLRDRDEIEIDGDVILPEVEDLDLEE